MLLTGAACTDDATAPSTTAVATSSTSTTIRPDDGVFLIGLVVPTVGTGAEIGASLDNGVALAAQEINVAGGVNGQRVQIVRREEGDNPATAQLAMQDLVQLGVDVIVGPTSSANVLGSLQLAVDNNVLTCSPTATALALDGFPDQGVFLRSIPSDTLQAEAIAAMVEESGTEAAAVVYLDDPYGRPLAAAVQTALARQGTTVAVAVGFNPAGDSLEAAVAQVTTADADTVVVVADATAGPLVITAIDDATSGARPTFVVNDAIRRPAASAEPFRRALAARIIGVSPLAYADDDTFHQALMTLDPTASGLYAHNAYDCVNLAALAAEAAASTRAGAVAAAVVGVSSGGTGCRTFAVCAEALRAQRNIDYDGPSGTLAIDPDGDPSAAVFERFGFDESGRDVGQGTLIVGDD